MATFDISTDIICTITADGKTRLSDDFHRRLLEQVHKYLAKAEGSVTLTKVIEQTPSYLKIGLYCRNGTKGYNEFAKNITTAIKSMTEYGRDSDVMNMILNKYPALKEHPRLNELVGSFDMLSAKVSELAKDHKSKPSQATPVLAKAPVSKGPASKSELRRSREEKLKGQAPDQLAAVEAKVGVDLAQIVTPPQQPGTINVFDLEDNK